MSRGELLSLTKIIDLAETGGYTLPEDLTAAYAAYTKVANLSTEKPNRLSLDGAAAELVASLSTDQPLSAFDQGRRFDQAVTDRRVFGHAQTVLEQAREQAANTATSLAYDLTEKIITEHLRPAFDDVIEQARTAAEVLAGHSLNPAALLTAPAKVRNAYLSLAPLVARRSAIYEACGKANVIGHRQPQQDQQHLSAMFRRPMIFHPNWKAPAQIPRLPIPEDPTQSLLWMAADATATAAEPWLPTVVQQDTAWWEQFGEMQTNRAQAVQYARGFASY